ncbi:hypothetical protein IQ259_16330 [Fortiea sp. LEGE XX443]|uniref:hypothetical protein n=1 Tax=Fortiea sp. LEGE XX443 TaxID=1828611 RepID=UPI00188140C8|nr:hypothetical protein [Fortiea sp. LEGE XX443]MBE9006588.1 hypothetical protein [Fortiea sp. LEGE XX443]
MAKSLAKNNLYDGLKARKVSPKSVKPFINKEITAIIKGFEVLATHYTLFIKFLLFIDTPCWNQYVQSIYVMRKEVAP